MSTSQSIAIFVHSAAFNVLLDFRKTFLQCPDGTYLKCGIAVDKDILNVYIYFVKKGIRYKTRYYQITSHFDVDTLATELGEEYNKHQDELNYYFCERF